MALDLYQVPARKLDKFIFDTLQPDHTFLRQARQAIDTICEFLKTNCFTDCPRPCIKVLKVVKGGSLGKGTSLKGGSDADLVVFLSCFKGYSDQETNRAAIIKEIKRMLEKCQQQKHFEVSIKQSRWPNPRVLSFMMSSKTLDESIEFDVLPAYNALCMSCCPYSARDMGCDGCLLSGRLQRQGFSLGGESGPRAVFSGSLVSRFLHRSLDLCYPALASGAKPDSQVYKELIHSYSRGGEFSTCFTELQRDFVVDRPTKVKSLIRLVKYWYKQHIRPYKEYLEAGESLPPQYALELLSIYAWEQGSRDRAFDMAEGFRTVLELIRQYKKLCVYWTINYNFADELLERFLHCQLQKDRPIILDPADPTGIVGEGSRWDLVAQEAEFCCDQQCCMDLDGDPVQPWDVPPEQTLEGRRGFEIHTGAQEYPDSAPQPGPACTCTNNHAMANQQPSFCTILEARPLCSNQPSASAVPLPAQGLLQSRRSKRRSLSARGTHRLVPSWAAPVVRLLMELNQSMGLYQMPADELDTFITNDLQPNQVFKMQISTAIHTIFLFLTQNCFRNSGSTMRVLKVVKAGSSGKGTALKDVSDVDLVVFVSKITDFRALKAERKKIIAEIQTRLEECRGSLGKDLVLSIKKTKWENPRVLTFTLTSNTTGEHIDFDVLPAFDALGQLYRGYKPDPAVYIRLTESNPEGSEFSPCFTELQRNFIMALPTKLKSLIRLVKHWYKQYVLPHKKKLGWKESLPPQYALELLSVYAWERGGRGPAFNMAEGFRTVLELIRQHAQLCVYWTINYGFENETLGWYLKSQLYKSRPIILDPADPTGIVGHGSRWDLVAEEAERCCAQKCCWKRNGSAVQPWNVPLQQTWRAAEGDDFDLQSRTTDKEYPITENQMFANGSHAAEEESYCTLL
ncbi:2'-5'-oligoadenylate synthase 2-like [Natator depressus]|uniref:2'-5'-oligoadenylate synthase 2-like n=1 Tax=Natator depressus TaxID=27790 RepID=UPI003EC0AF1A